jgi:hypothetical protein
MRIELDIDELVLDDFKPHERFRIRAAIERELEGLLSTEGGLQPLQQDREISYLDGGTLEDTPSFTGRAIGSRVARALCGALRR